MPCPDASPVCEPCEERHGTMVKNYWIPVGSYYIPFRFRIVAGVGCMHYKSDGGTRDEGNHDEESHGGTWAAEWEVPHYPERTIES